MEINFKELSDKINKKKLNIKDLSNLSQYILCNINNMIQDGDKLIIEEDGNLITLGFINYGIINGILKELDYSSQEIIKKKIKNIAYSQEDFEKEKHKSLIESLTVMANHSKKYGGSPFSNYEYREDIINYTIKQKYPSLKRQDKKVDFVCNELSILNGETKSGRVSLNKDGNYSNCKFEFDKQNDPIRQENTLKNDAYIFAGFDSNDISDSKILFYCFLYKKEDLLQIKKLMKKKQEEFNQKMNIFKKEEK